MDRNQRAARRDAQRQDDEEDPPVDDLGPRVRELTAEQLMQFMNERFPVQQRQQAPV